MNDIIINKNSADQRLDKFLSKRFKNMPVALIYKYIRTKRIKVNGKRAKENYILAENDIVSCYIPAEFLEQAPSDNAFTKLKRQIDIVFEDENILLVHKKSGVIVHSDENEELDTLINHVKAYLYDKGEYDPKVESSFAPALCNRIDRNTEGIVIAAKNAAALRVMNDIIRDREINKLYLAAVHGFLTPREGKLTSYLEKNSAENRVYISKNPNKNTKTAELEYKVVSENKELSLSLLEIKLITGRTHQIRAQMADKGNPLLGDGKYAVNKTDRLLGYKSQALCAYSLSFKFTQDRGELGYLNGKTFKTSKPDFTELFY